jgi:hypothetical protein
LRMEVQRLSDSSIYFLIRSFYWNFQCANPNSIRMPIRPLRTVLRSFSGLTHQRIREVARSGL